MKRPMLYTVGRDFAGFFVLREAMQKCLSVKTVLRDAFFDYKKILIKSVLQLLDSEHPVSKIKSNGAYVAARQIARWC